MREAEQEIDTMRIEANLLWGEEFGNIFLKIKNMTEKLLEAKYQHHIILSPDRPNSSLSEEILEEIEQEYPHILYSIDTFTDSSETSEKDNFADELNKHFDDIETYLKEKMRPFLSAT